jgi:hypothetical protein
MLLLTVLLLSGTVLAATAVAGLLMLYQIRQTTNTADSAKAVFAADAGIDWALYQKLKNPVQPQPIFSNGAEVQVVFSPDGKLVKSTGSAGGVSRAFELRFDVFIP